MAQAVAKGLTLEQFLALPETRPASEFIDGEIAQKPMPQGKHSRIQGELTAAINAVLRLQRVACAFPELRCTFGGRSLVPDVAVFAWERIPRDEDGEVANVFELPPDWTIEILSPEQSPTRVMKNILHCLQFGTQLGWLIDLAGKAVAVYRPKQEMVVLDRPDEELLVPDFARSLKLTVQGLFGCLVL